MEEKGRGAGKGAHAGRHPRKDACGRMQDAKKHMCSERGFE